MFGHTRPSSHAAAVVRGWRVVLNAKIPALCEPGRAVLIGLKVFGSPEYDDANRRDYVHKVTTGRDSDYPPKRGVIHGLSKRSRRRFRNQARTLIFADCIDQNVAATLRFPRGMVTEGKEAQKRFTAYFACLERWAKKQGATVACCRVFEKAKDEETIHVHTWT